MVAGLRPKFAQPAAGVKPEWDLRNQIRSPPPQDFWMPDGIDLTPGNCFQAAAGWTILDFDLIRL